MSLSNPFIKVWDGFWDWMAGVSAFKEGWHNGYKVGYELGTKKAHADIIAQAKAIGIDLHIVRDQEEALAIQERLTRTIH